ncbi:MAG TPA: HlyD family efflux transporter periplasmic adaptor subunit [Pirellulales bacterium]|nr:HlyD family efflux transporter periplasmic adaptor subunit [Pirellulales bacterium]
MSRWGWLLLALGVCGCAKPQQWSVLPAVSAADIHDSSPAATADAGTLVVAGETLPAPGRVSEIGSAVMHPVERVFVKPGDMVRAGQPLFELDMHEPEAEVRARHAEVEQLKASLAKLKAMPRSEERAQARAELESAHVASTAAREYLERLEKLREHDAVSARQSIEQRTVLRRAEADELAAQAHLDYLTKLPIEHEIAEAEQQLAVAQATVEAAEAELEHYTVMAAIDGVVCWLDATPGSVHRAGTKIWGEIVDLREVDVRVELTPRQLRDIDTSKPIRIELPEVEQSWSAKFVYAAPAANRQSGRVPVVLRVTDADPPLRCHLGVTVTFARLAENRPTAAAHRSLAGGAASID